MLSPETSAAGNPDTVAAVDDNGLSGPGTSLSKGYGLIERFSEDLDLKLDGPGLPKVANWRADNKAALKSRQAFYQALMTSIGVPGTLVEELPELRDNKWRNVVLAGSGPFSDGSQTRPHSRVTVGSLCKSDPVPD